MKKIQILRDLTSNILETMYFLVQETPPDEPNYGYKYAVSIKDPRVDIILMFCEQTAREMSVNFLGINEIELQDIHDTLKESINIIAGNFICAELAEYTKKINIPTMLEPDKIDDSTYESAILFYNEEPVKILLKLE